MLTFIDVETTTHNKGHPFDERNFLVSYAVKQGTGLIVFKYYHDPDFISYLRATLASASLLVGFNIKFDLHWIARTNVAFSHCKVWDCSLAEFILSGQTAGFISLNEALEQYGLPTKTDLVAEYWARGISTENIPVYILQEYNEWDVTVTELLYNVQKELLSGPQQTLLMLEGEDLKALQHAEFHGIKWDQVKAEAKLVEYRKQLAEIESRLNKHLIDLPATFKFNWDSGDHLSAFLYGGVIRHDYAIQEQSVYKSGPHKGEAYTRNRWYETSCTFPKRFTPLEGTEVAKTAKDSGLPPDRRFYQVDAPTLRQLKGSKVDKEILADLDERSKVIKVVEMVESIMTTIREKNWADNYLHPQFNQNTVRTGRLSSSAPNMQNTPVEVDELLVSRYAD